ncbi:hypothetical protein [Streptomyces sp. NPDC001530]|uniref:hypothetical protein n=1 Tax=Streptomyces sp. NPDC001530 TaxID=3364582 RepID=UPI00368616C7
MQDPAKRPVAARGADTLQGGHDRVIEVDLADLGLKVESQQQVDMSMTCSSAGEGRIKVELAVDGTRVASYTGAAFDERGCGVAAFHYSATDPQGTAFHAGFECFTASEPLAR